MNDLYETDFYRWTQETADRLRRGEVAQADIPALVEEVEDLGKKQKSALHNRLAVLIGHLLKWDFQPSKRSRSWEATIELQRKSIERLLKESPSLQPFLSQILPDAYGHAILRAIKETGLDRKTFSQTCPYTLEEILSAKNVSEHC